MKERQKEGNVLSTTQMLQLVMATVHPRKQLERHESSGGVGSVAIQVRLASGMQRN